MPFDSKGKHHMNGQRARNADKAQGSRDGGGPRTPTYESNAKKDEAEMDASARGESDSGSDDANDLHTNPDGSCAECGEPNAQVGHSLMHTAHKHAPEGTHMHIHDDGFTHTSHHVKEDGKVEGPHEHSSPEEAGEHVKQVFGGMEHEGATPEAGAMGHLGMNSHPAKLMSGI